MGRATSGVTGMKFRRDDDLLSMSVVPEGEEPFVFVVFETGMAKRTPVSAYRVQGRGETAQRILADAKAIEAAGAFAVVMEMVPGDVAAQVTAELSIPTIGIGAGNGCDGQVLVWQDAFGLRTGRMARFVKQYADVHAVLRDAAAAYSADVKAGTFPGPEHTF